MQKLKKWLFVFKLTMCFLLSSCSTQSQISVNEQDEIKKSFRLLVDKGYYPGGAILIRQNGKTVIEDSYGVVDLETKKKFSTDQLCWLASTGKMFTATLMASLVDDGLISFDDPISKYYPQLSNIKLHNGKKPKQQILLRHILSHTSGIPNDNWLENYRSATVGNPGQYKKYFEPRSALDFIDACLKLGVANEPGIKMMYGTPIDIAACIAEKVTGKKFTQLMYERVIQPLKLRNTTVVPTDEQLKSIAPLYSSSTPGKFKPDALSKYVANRQRTRFTTAGGCVFSTLEDVSTLLQLHLNKGRFKNQRLISETSLSQLYMPQPGTENKYGLAFMIKNTDDTRIYYHPGYSGPVGWIDFERKLIGVMLMQSNTKGRDQLHQTVIETVNKVIPKTH